MGYQFGTERTPFSHERKLLGLGKMEKLRGNRHCSMDRCERTEVAVLAEQAFCLNHFVRRCYDRLERLDPRGRKSGVEDRDLHWMRADLEECSEQTLRICLSGRPLTNLERGRLLDILLWAGELYVLLRLPGGFCPGVERFRNMSLEARALASKAV